MWDGYSLSYDEQYAHGIKSSGEKSAWSNLLKRELGSSKYILDVGTGTGFLAVLAANLGHTCLGIDLSEKMMEVGKKKVKSEGLSKKVSFEIGDAESLSYEDNTFDVVMNRHLLWTLPDPEKALKEWKRVLKPGGKIIIINGAWSTFGLGQKSISFLGKMLIAIQEQKNPWSGDYEKDLKNKLPLYNNVEPLDIEKILKEIGFSDVSCIDMNDVYKEEVKALPLRYRLAYRHERYTVTGIK
ncbi:Ubiquinone/menaquinone biosynthesis C-methylase UbiE [Desulfonispora thiosulfatigenes DSM 11270]|uniref:Ubiquinone/menaquinone biosynthesis C-methylase UbiE n=1 Tax=Desulfonispora thiosulfatigenes DSM 11270 TaxID=656914 RepID=A0A1W1V8L2_DESTI|nr:class I SAM-dependent methyltransferase [Desulfonispora thiosulfatigenes]SMB89692.1 Ubiquinone/menaquinone biosynthesis C-methylase UbiE [Desulfonispora thiosulfatigenes DSM 11270]